MRSGILAESPEFCIRFLADPSDTVFDIFAGSNMTGTVAGHWKRFLLGRWLTRKLRRL